MARCKRSRRRPCKRRSSARPRGASPGVRSSPRSCGPASGSCRASWTASTMPRWRTSGFYRDPALARTGRRTTRTCCTTWPERRRLRPRSDARDREFRRGCARVARGARRPRGHVRLPDRRPRGDRADRGGASGRAHRHGGDRRAAQRTWLHRAWPRAMRATCMFGSATSLTGERATDRARLGLLRQAELGFEPGGVDARALPGLGRFGLLRLEDTPLDQVALEHVLEGARSTLAAFSPASHGGDRAPDDCH